MQQSKVRLSEQQGVKVMLSTKQMTSDVKDLSLMSLKENNILIMSVLKKSSSRDKKLLKWR